MAKTTARRKPAPMKPLPAKRRKDRPVKRPPARKPRQPPSPETRLENALIKRAQQGDAAALAELTAKYTPMLHKFAKLRANSELDREDFFQIAYVYFFRCVQKFNARRKTRFITYCYSRIELQLLRDRHEYNDVIRVPYSSQIQDRNARIRTQNVEIMHSDDDGGVDFDHPSTWAEFSEDIIGEMVAAEELAGLRAAIDALPPRERYVLRKRMDGAQTRDLSVEMGISRSRTGQIENRAFLRLREMLTGSKVLTNQGPERRMAIFRN